MAHAPAALLASPALQTSTKLIACVLWQLGPRASELPKGSPVFVWPGVPYLSRATAQSTSTVERALRQLRAHGWIARAHGADARGQVRLGWHRFAEANLELAAALDALAPDAPVDKSVDSCGAVLASGPSPVTGSVMGDGEIPSTVTDIKGKEELKGGRASASACAASRPARSGPAAAQQELDFDLSEAAACAVLRFAPPRRSRTARADADLELDAPGMRAHARGSGRAAPGDCSDAGRASRGPAETFEANRGPQARPVFGDLPAAHLAVVRREQGPPPMAGAPEGSAAPGAG